MQQLSIAFIAFDVAENQRLKPTCFLLAPAFAVYQRGCSLLLTYSRSFFRAHSTELNCGSPGERSIKQTRSQRYLLVKKATAFDQPKRVKVSELYNNME